VLTEKGGARASCQEGHEEGSEEESYEEGSEEESYEEGSEEESYEEGSEEESYQEARLSRNAAKSEGLWVPKTRPSLLSRRYARRDRISRGAARPP
jgi:hypothetical protein